jgi:hypothetical protein
VAGTNFPREINLNFLKSRFDYSTNGSYDSIHFETIKRNANETLLFYEKEKRILGSASRYAFFDVFSENTI